MGRMGKGNSAFVPADYDFEILRQIRQDSRKSIAAIATATGKSPVFILKRLFYLEKAAIKKYVSIIDFSAFSLLRVDVVAVPKKDKLQELVGLLIRAEGVNNAFIAGTHVYAECVFNDMRSMYLFIDTISMFSVSVKKHYVISEAKEIFMPYPVLSAGKGNIVYPRHFFHG